MLFNSVEFIFFFLPLTLTGFFVFAKFRGHLAAILWLVAASLFFYGWWNPIYLILISVSILFNYSFGILLSRRQEQHTSFLVVGVAFNLALLGYFKYANFFVDSVNYIADSSIALPPIVLPLAISFFTFQQIAYLVDAYRGETREYSFIHYCLFVCFFPQLIAGPIVHHKEMLPQFARVRTFSPRVKNFAVGGTIFCIGLFKKVVIADTMALHATPIFELANAGATLGFFDAWQGALAYTFQLYFDFSGYSDMAIGLARLFGIVLPVNFNSPYRATNIIDFWRRWHMTLSRFLRDYLYIALGGNRHGKIRRYINLMLTMLLGGLWHGAGWTFVVWGALHGIYLVINHFWHALTGKQRRFGALGVFVARCVTFLSVVVGWVFFRAESFAAALTVLKGMMNLPTSLNGKFGPLQAPLEAIGFRFSGGYVAAEHLQLVVWLFICMAVVWFWPNTQEWMRRYRPILESHSIEQPLSKRLAWRPTPAWALITGTVALASLLGLSSVTEFLYFQF